MKCFYHLGIKQIARAGDPCSRARVLRLVLLASFSATSALAASSAPVTSPPAAPAPASAPAVKLTRQRLSYKNTTLTVEAPEEWAALRTEQDHPQIVKYHDTNTDVLASVELDVVTLGKGQTLQDVADAHHARLKSEGRKNIERTSPDKEARHIVLTFDYTEDDVLHMNRREIILADDTHALVITASAPDAQWKEFLPTMKAIIASVGLTTEKP